MKNSPLNSFNNLAKLAMNRMRTFSATSVLCCLAFFISYQSVQATYLTSTNVQGSSPGSWTVNLDWQTNTASPGAGTAATQIGPKFRKLITQLPHWPEFNATDCATMIFDDESKVVNDPLRKKRIAMFDALNLT